MITPKMSKKFILCTPFLRSLFLHTIFIIAESIHNENANLLQIKDNL